MAALDKANLEFLLFQREQLQHNVLDPLQRIKGAIGRCLQPEQVQIIKSLLNRDLHDYALVEVRDGENLIDVFDLFYGQDNLQFIESLLIEANLENLVQMLRKWKSRNKTLIPNVFYQYGFSPLWIKVSYSFIEFSKRRQDIFNTLKHVFGIPDTDPAVDPMVYMGVSLGKRDVLLCVLVPHSVRHHIKTSLRHNEIAPQLKSAHINGVYFSRVSTRSKDGIRKDTVTGSQLSISLTSESMTSSDFGELHDAAYEDITNAHDHEDYTTTQQEHQPNSRNQITQQEPLESILDENTNNGYHGDDLRGRHGKQGHVANNNKPRLVRISSGYVEEDPSNKVAKVGGKPSYGECFFVDYKSMSVKSSNSKPSSTNEESNSSTARGSRHYDENSLDSKSRDQEELLFSQKSDFTFNEPSRLDGNNGNEQLTCRQANDGERGSGENQESPWYNQGLEDDHEYTARQTPEKASSYVNGWRAQSDTEARENERNRSYYGNVTNQGFHGDKQDEDHHYHGNEQNHHRDEYGYNEEHHYHGNEQNQHRDEDGYNENDRYYHGNEQGYHGDMLDHYGDHHSLYKNERDYDYHGNGESHHGNRNSDVNSESNYYDDDQSYHSNKYTTNGYHGYEQDLGYHHYGYHGNEQHYSDTIHRDDVMVPEPEPETSFSEGAPNQRSTSSLFYGFDPMRRSTPNSSASGFSNQEFPCKPTVGNISRSMPTLYPRDTGYPEGRRTYRPKYESQADLDDNVFLDSTAKFGVSPPPYSAPPNYQDTMIKKSFMSLSSVCADSRCKKVENPLLSSQSVSSIYKEKEQLLNRDELQESIRSAEEKQWEILLDKSKDFLTAAKLGEEDEVKRLLDEGVDVDYKNEFGHTALMVASREGHLPVVHVLITYSSDLNIQDKYGKSALHEAAWSGHHQVIQPLVAKDANINCLDEEGRSPLQYAALRGKTKVAEVLLLLGADTSIVNKDGDTAVELAYHCRHKDIVKLLLKSTDKKTRKDMKGQIRKLQIQRIKSATSLPNLNKNDHLKYFKRSKSKPELRKNGKCVTQ